jgi:hypothetical protein
MKTVSLSGPAGGEGNQLKTLALCVLPEEKADLIDFLSVNYGGMNDTVINGYIDPRPVPFLWKHFSGNRPSGQSRGDIHSDRTPRQITITIPVKIGVEVLSLIEQKLHGQAPLFLDNI